MITKQTVFMDAIIAYSRVSVKCEFGRLFRVETLFFIIPTCLPCALILAEGC